MLQVSLRCLHDETGEPKPAALHSERSDAAVQHDFCKIATLRLQGQQPSGMIRARVA